MGLHPVNWHEHGAPVAVGPVAKTSALKNTSWRPVVAQHDCQLQVFFMGASNSIAVMVLKRRQTCVVRVADWYFPAVSFCGALPASNKK
jgi:hypothetical protein